MRRPVGSLGAVLLVFLASGSACRAQSAELDELLRAAESVTTPEDVRVEAVAQLADLGPAAADGLVRIRAIATTGAPELREVCVFAIAEIGGARQLEVLLEFLDDESPEVQRTTIKCLAAVVSREPPRDRRFEGAIRGAARRPSEEVRIEAIRCARQCSVDLGPDLSALLRDADSFVRREALRYAAGRGDSPCLHDVLRVAYFDERDALRSQALEVLSGYDRAAVDQALVTDLQSEDAWQRHAAAKACAHFPSPQALRSLTALLLDPDPHVSGAAGFSYLRLFGSRAWWQAPLALLWRPTAAWALIGAGGLVALMRLLRGLPRRHARLATGLWCCCLGLLAANALGRVMSSEWEIQFVRAAGVEPDAWPLRLATPTVVGVAFLAPLAVLVLVWGSPTTTFGSPTVK